MQSYYSITEAFKMLHYWPILLCFVLSFPVLALLNWKIRSVFWKALIFSLILPLPLLFCFDSCGWLLIPYVAPILYSPGIGLHFLGPISILFYLEFLGFFALIKYFFDKDCKLSFWYYYLAGIGFWVILLFFGWLNWYLAFFLGFRPF